MNRCAFLCVLPLLLLLSGCLTSFEPSLESKEVIVLANSLEGQWSVEEYDKDEKYRQVGTLTIDGDNYSFQPSPDIEVPLWMRERFCIFDDAEGQITFEYEAGISPDDDIQKFEDHKILVKCQGIGCDEIFLIRVDQEDKGLYFHSAHDELQQYRIHKSYED